MSISREKSKQIIKQIFLHVNDLKIHGGTLLPEFKNKKVSTHALAFFYKSKQFVISPLPRIFRLANGSSFELFLITQDSASSNDWEQIYPSLPDTAWETVSLDTDIDEMLSKIYQNCIKLKESQIDKVLGDKFFDEE